MGNFELPITTWSDDVAVSADETNAEIIGNIQALIDNLPTRALMLHLPFVPTVESGNAMVKTLDASQLLGFYTNQEAARADGDEFTYSFVLAAGTYEMTVLGMENGNSAKIDWDLNGTLIAVGQDWNGGATYNVEKTVSGIVIAAADAGRHVLTGTINGRSAGADWLIRLTAISFKQASDT